MGSSSVKTREAINTTRGKYQLSKWDSDRHQHVHRGIKALDSTESTGKRLPLPQGTQ